MTGDYEPEIDDIRDMRKHGDLRAFMRQQIDAGRSRRESPARHPVSPSPPGHRPGVWPTGTSPPGPPPDWRIPAPVWRAAVRHYSNQLHRPDQPCDCGNCPSAETEEN